MGDLLEQGRRMARDVAWFVRGVMGEDAYEKYRQHYVAVHGEDDDPALPSAMMTEREFWRDRTDRQDSNPEGRCC
jgi:uncharacterized short protein YbdD (DUF466 family)